jgi:hypothetical protein
MPPDPTALAVMTIELAKIRGEQSVDKGIKYY